ncbi:10402_t:CDS:2 [Cetraspora pellucida]|uniref:10402_t:CDS:1 n=1 Tax=Cetraspora pellucida TaxID=1433469 RepID=A0A9N9I4Z4_9GLOM|nr:10402_t:CDS:2 [Cetraspora pellucida]
MKALENRTLDSKREMDILDALDEIRTRNARNERVDADALVAKAIFNTVDGDKVKRVADDEPELSQLLSESAKSFVIPKFNSTSSADKNKVVENSTKRKNVGSELGIMIKKKKTNNNSLLVDYGSSDSEDS